MNGGAVKLHSVLENILWGIADIELVKNGKKDITVFDEGNILSKRKCPISEKRIECAKCNPCSIMNGFGGAGAFSDGKFNITNDFGGSLYEKIGYDKSLELQGEVDNINHNFLETVGFPKIYFSAESKYKKICLQNNLHLLRAGVRHLGTDNNIKNTKLNEELLKKTAELLEENTKKNEILIQNANKKLEEQGSELINNINDEIKEKLKEQNIKNEQEPAGRRCPC